MSGRWAAAVLALGVILWLGAVTAGILPLLGRDVDDLGAPPLQATTCPNPAIGVNSALAFEGDPQLQSDSVAAIDDELGAQVVRDSLLWSQIEPTEGERDWSVSDAMVRDLRVAGIEPLLAVFGSPPWANGVPEATPGQYLHIPPRGAAFDAWLERYSDFLAAAVERYRDYVNRWEIWNEPNLVDFWRPRPDPAAYRRVYETLRSTILSVDPEAQVAVGGLSSLSVASGTNIPGLAFLRRLEAARVPLDNVAVHPYPTDDHAPDRHVPGENNFDDIERVHDQLAAAGERAPIWVTEWGWSSATVGESRQTRFVDRSLAMIENRYPFVPVATYFNDHDRPPEFLQGLLGENLEPKPAALAFQARAERLAAGCERRGQ